MSSGLSSEKGRNHGKKSSNKSSLKSIKSEKSREKDAKVAFETESGTKEKIKSKGSD